MSISQVEIQLIAIVTAVACALPGTFLVLRRIAMLSDAISHTVLLGIVLAFFVIGDLSSPLLILGAASVGVLTVSLVGLLQRTRLVKEDASIGLVFPALFSIAVILISRYAGNVHLDTDAVLTGEIAFAPFDRLRILGLDIGPRGFYVMFGILFINLVFILIFYKELKLSSFDTLLAASLGFAPVGLHYALMGLVSVTIVSAFDIVGSVLVVALMITPPAAAYLLTDRLSHMLMISSAIGALSAVSGYWLAYFLDTSIAGSIAMATGIFFLIIFLFAPQRGVFAILRSKAKQKFEFSITLLTGHLLNHENKPEEVYENCIEHLYKHMRWDEKFAQVIITKAVQEKLVKIEQGCVLRLTEAGRYRASEGFLH